MLIYNIFQLCWLIKINYSQMVENVKMVGIYIFFGTYILCYVYFTITLWYGILLTKHN